MAGVSLKKDFKDGDKLFGQQLNNNFGAIEAALNAMNKIVWQDDPDDMVVTFRGTTEEINSREVIDGQLLYDTTTGETYIDYGSQRISTGSGNVIFVGNTVPSNPATMIWINPDASINEDMFKYKYGNQWYTVGIKASDTLPIGNIAPYGGETAPTNWLICDGSAVSRTTYSDLFSVIGTSFGSGDGSTTFNLPDLRSRVPLGKDSRDTDFDTIGDTFGEKKHTLTVDEMPSHTHNTTIPYATNSSSFGYNNWAMGNGGEDHVSTQENGALAKGGSQAHNIVQPSLVTNYIIKAFQSVGVVGNVVKTYTESDVDVYPCNYINDTCLKSYIINQTIAIGNSYQNDLLKNAKLVICDWTIASESWVMQTIHITDGYSLNTYGTASNGSIYNSTSGTITAQYTDSDMHINRILVIK